jgi:hypothetical protein
MAPVRASKELFSVETVISAIQTGMEYQHIKDLFECHDSTSVKIALTKCNDGFPAIFSAVDQSRLDLFNLMVEHGADPNARAYDSGMPVLAFAILQTTSRTVEVVKILLSLGADPWLIPTDLWESDTDIPHGAQSSSRGDQASGTCWCTDDLRASLKRHLNLTLRYNLLQASKIVPPTMKEWHVAHSLKIKPLIQAPYFLIGQKFAIDHVKKYVMSHQVSQSRGPLVLVFLGPSGHGKRELARQMGSMLTLQSLVMECKKARCRTGSFGSECSDNITASHLCHESNELKVIYIDDLNNVDSPVLGPLLEVIDKGTWQLWGKSILAVLTTTSCLPFPGVYRHKGCGREVDCSKAICILATTHAAETIVDFYQKNLQSRPQKTWTTAPWEYLDKAIRKDLANKYGVCRVPSQLHTKEEKKIKERREKSTHSFSPRSALNRKTL